MYHSNNATTYDIKRLRMILNKKLLKYIYKLVVESSVSISDYFGVSGLKQIVELCSPNTSQRAVQFQ